jgi:hypothetical protein
MRLTNFSIEDNYAIKSGDAWIDLHNDYDFTGVEYDLESNCLAMKWKRATKHSTIASASQLVVWFRQLQFLRLELIEDAQDILSAKTLEFVGFLHQDDVDVMSGCLSQEEADESFHLIFRFENTFAIKCFCREVECNFG